MGIILATGTHRCVVEPAGTLTRRAGSGAVPTALPPAPANCPSSYTATHSLLTQVFNHFNNHYCYKFFSWLISKSVEAFHKKILCRHALRVPIEERSKDFIKILLK